MADAGRNEDPDGFVPSGWLDGVRLPDSGEREGAASGRTDDVHEWFGNNIPSGQRGGVDEEAAAKLAKRQRHEQTIGTQDRQIRKFSGAQFIAHLSDKISFDRNGDMVLTVKVPFQFKHLALPLTDAFGIPLSVDVQVWQPYREVERS